MAGGREEVTRTGKSNTGKIKVSKAKLSHRWTSQNLQYVKNPDTWLEPQTKSGGNFFWKACHKLSPAPSLGATLILHVCLICCSAFHSLHNLLLRYLSPPSPATSYAVCWVHSSSLWLWLATQGLKQVSPETTDTLKQSSTSLKKKKKKEKKKGTLHLVMCNMLMSLVASF